MKSYCARNNFFCGGYLSSGFLILLLWWDIGLFIIASPWNISVCFHENILLLINGYTYHVYIYWWDRQFCYFCFIFLAVVFRKNFTIIFGWSLDTGNKTEDSVSDKKANTLAFWLLKEAKKYQTFQRKFTIICIFLFFF